MDGIGGFRQEFPELFIDKERRASILSLKTRDRKLNEKPRSRSVCAPGVLRTERGKMIAVDILEGDETEEPGSTRANSDNDGDRSVNLADSPMLKMEDLRKKEDRNQARASAMVTSGALTFILLAASLVTTSFLISPVIEDIFGEEIIYVENSW